MEKKIISSNYAEAINRLKEASANSRILRKSRYDGISTTKLLTSNAMKHSRVSSQVINSNTQMRNISRILSPSRSNNRSTSMKRK